MMLTTPILLDYQSSTPCLEEVVNSMGPYWSEIFSNPSSKSNLAGINASAILEVSREKIQEYLFLKIVVRRIAMIKQVWTNYFESSRMGTK